MVHREKKHFLKSDGQTDREWDKDGPRRRGGQTSRRGLLERPEAESEELRPQSDNVVHGRSLSWIRTGPSELGPGGPGRKGGGGGGAGEETPPKLSKSSLLFPQKTSLSALASRAKQILSNSSPGNNAANAHLHDNAARNHGNDKNAATGNNNNREKKDENKIYITRPRPVKEREREKEERRAERERVRGPGSRHPREVFPGVFLYQSGKTTRLVNLQSTRSRGGGGVGSRGLVTAPQLWPKPPLRDGKVPPRGTNASVSRQGTVHQAASRVAVVRLRDRERRRVRGGGREHHTPPEREATADATLPSKRGTQLPQHLQPPPPHSPTPPNSLENAQTIESRVESRLETRVTSYLKTSEITESQQKQPDPDQEPSEPDPDPDPIRSNADPEPDPEPEPEEGGVSDYSYEAEEARPGWAEVRCDLTASIVLN